MPRGGEARTLARREEIISACETLYAERGFKDVTIKDIGERTSFTRTSIYNYFETKEEIFLALLHREYQGWTADLTALSEAKDRGTEPLSRGLAASLDRRQTMLRLMSTSLFEMEENSRVEALAAFKQAFYAMRRALEACVLAHCPGVDANGFLFTFLPFVYGVYPYSTVTEKQRAAMAQAGVDYHPPTVYDMVYRGAMTILEGLKNQQ